MFSQRIALTLGLLGLAGCATTPSTAAAPADAGVSEAQALADRVTALEAEATTVLHDLDEALWQHWTTGAPLDLGKARQGHETLLSPATLETLRRARALQATDATRLTRLEAWVAGELLAQGVAEENAALASLEATVTFTVDGREYAWRDLPRLLVSEKSAVKRRALWVGSQQAALSLDTAIARRDARLAEVATSLGLAKDFDATSRGLSASALRADAEALLAVTDEEWRATLQRASDADVKLPLTALTRADLPRVMRVPGNVDAEFGKDKLPARLATVGGLDTLRVDLGEAAGKNFVPLAVAPTRDDVRLSARPMNGLREQQQVLGEVGVALQLRRAARLELPGAAMEQAELYAGLLRDDAWLTEAGVTLRAETIAAARALWLFQNRRAAARFLAKLDTDAMTDETAARAKYVERMGQALGLQLPPEEGARFRVDTTDAWRAAAQLDAALKAEQRRSKLDGAWWKAAPPK